MQQRKFVSIFVLVASFWLWAGHTAGAAMLEIKSQTYPEAITNVPWGLPVEFEVTDVVPFPPGTTFSFDFGDGQTLDTSGPFASHLYTYDGLPAACVPAGAGADPPDVCIDPGMITVTVDIADSLGFPISMETIDLQLRRQKGIPLTEEERGLLDAAIEAARMALDPADRDEDKALRELNNAEDSLRDARKKVTQSMIDPDLAELEDAADQDERVLSRFVKSIRALEDATSMAAIAQRGALFEALHTVVDAVLNRLRAVDPCCDEELRRAIKRFGRAVVDIVQADFSSAANTLLKVYGIVEDEKYPLGFPADLPSKKAGAPLSEGERDTLEDAVSTALAALGASRNEEKAGKSFQKSLNEFGKAIPEVLAFNFSRAAKKDERGVRSVVKGLRNLQKEDGTESIQADLTMVLRDVIGEVLDRVEVVVGPIDDARASFERGLDKLADDDFFSAAADFKKAYSKVRDEDVEP